MKSDNPKSAVIYARVSSREQQEEGYSIDAQLKLLRDYAAKNALAVSEEYIDVETAKECGRTQFGVMLDALPRFSEAQRIILVEKTDRLYRNIYDWVKVDQLRTVIHFVKDGYVLSEESRSNEKFIHGIKVLMAKNYVDNLSEEVRKGLDEKAEQGIWPLKAPFGYRDVRVNGKHHVEPDPEVVPIIRRMFEWYATGDYSVSAVRELAVAAGLKTRGGNPVVRSEVERILKNPFYAGRFIWKGKEYDGKHPALVSVELFEKVQWAFRKDGKPETKRMRLFPYTGLIKCSFCGCSVTAERKKQLYVYYHCTGGRGPCRKPYIREEQLEALLGGVVRDIAVDRETALWVRGVLRESHLEERDSRERQLDGLRRQRTELERRLSTAYDDKLDGKIPESLWLAKSRECQVEMARLDRAIATCEAEPGPYYEQVERIVELAEAAPRLYSQQEPREKAKLLRILLSNCTFDGENLHPDYKKPFCWFVKTKEHPSKLGCRDSNPD